MERKAEKEVRVEKAEKVEKVAKAARAAEEARRRLMRMEKLVHQGPSKVPKSEHVLGLLLTNNPSCLVYY